MFLTTFLFFFLKWKNNSSICHFIFYSTCKLIINKYWCVLLKFGLKYYDIFYLNFCLYFECLKLYFILNFLYNNYNDMEEILNIDKHNQIYLSFRKFVKISPSKTNCYLKTQNYIECVKVFYVKSSISFNCPELIVFLSVLICLIVSFNTCHQVHILTF